MMDSQILDLLKKASVKYGIPTQILYSIVMTESSGNTYQRTVTDTEDSRGLFQVNKYANPDANSSQLFNAEYNINYQVPKLVSTYKNGVKLGLTGSKLAQYVEQYGQKPQWNNTVANNITKYYNSYSGSDAPSDSDSSPSSSDSDTTTQTPTSYGDSMFSGLVATVMNEIKFGFTYLILFVLLLFAGYMVFIKEGGKTDGGN